MADSPAPAFASMRVLRRMPLVIWLPVVAAALLIGHSLANANELAELALVGVAVVVLATGHALLRAHARRMTAPLLVIHDHEDDIVPFSHGADLARLWMLHLKSQAKK